MRKLTVLFVLITSTATASDILEFKNGVIFNHKGHQTVRVGKCYVCHDNVSVSADEKTVVNRAPGRINGFCKEWAHKNCKDCHDLYGEGPVECSGCHLKRVTVVK